LLPSFCVGREGGNNVKIPLRRTWGKEASPGPASPCRKKKREKCDPPPSSQRRGGKKKGLGSKARGIRGERKKFDSQQDRFQEKKRKRGGGRLNKSVASNEGKRRLDWGKGFQAYRRRGKKLNHRISVIPPKGDKTDLRDKEERKRLII